MKDEKKERFPACVPLPYRAFALTRKALRQAAVRQSEAAARRRPPSNVLEDGEAQWTPRTEANLRYAPAAVNKSAFWIDEDLARPDVAHAAQAIESTKQKMKSSGLLYTNTAATFLGRMFVPRSERTKAWENAWVIVHSGVKTGQRVLDIGGASTPFSFHLADRGCGVSVLDNDWGNCGTIYNANHAARRMGWKLNAVDADAGRRFPFADASFDRVFSICTIEHMPSDVRRGMMREVGRVLAPGGIAGITFCYDPNHRVLTVDKGLRFGYRRKFMADVVEPSGLGIHGNTELVDFAEEPGFLGAVFLAKK